MFSRDPWHARYSNILAGMVLGAIIGAVFIITVIWPMLDVMR